MKKTAAILVFCMLLTCVFGSAPVFAAGQNARSIDFTQVDDKVFGGNNGGRDYVISNGYVGGLWPGSYTIYKGVDFGSEPAYSVDVYIGVPEEHAGSIELRADSPTGPLLAHVDIVGSGWDTQLKHTVKVPEPVTGVHDVYLVWTESTCHVFRAEFKAETKDTSGFLEFGESENFVDIEDNPYKNAIYTVRNLGLVDDYSDTAYNPNLPVTRGQFANTVSTILNGDLITPPGPVFADVPQDHEFANAINFLKSIGVVAGTTETYFRPSDFITVRDAVVMLVRALGYERLAQIKGGYPTGYMVIASEEDLFSGLNPDDIVRRDSMAGLLYNAIQANYLDDVQINANGEVTYQKVKGILGKTKNIESGSGTLTETAVSNLYVPESSLNSNRVKFGDEEFFVGSSDANAYLGYDCDYFYRVSGSDRILISVRPRTTVEQEILDTTQSDIEISEITPNHVIYFDENEDEQVINFASKANILYNGKAIDDDLSNLIGEGRFCGKIRCVDNGSGYNTIFIDQYESVIIDSIDAVKSTVHDKISNQDIRLDAKEDGVSFRKNGEIVSFSDIATNDIAVIYKSKNKTGKKLVRIYISESTVAGTIDETNGDIITINQTEYQLAKQRDGKFDVGQSGTFRLNLYGEVVAYKLSAAGDIQVGLMMKYDDGSGGGLIQSQQIKLLTYDNNVTILNCTQNVRIDGVTCKSLEETVDGVGNFSGLKNVAMYTPIRYRVNEANEITMIDTINTGSENQDDILRPLPTLAKGDYRYSSNDKVIWKNGGIGVAPISTDAKLIRGEGTDDTTFSIQPISEMSWDPAENGTGYTFDIEKGFCDIFVAGAKDTATNASPFVVDHFTKVVNEEGMTVDKLYGYQNGTEVSYEFDTSLYSEGSATTLQTLLNLKRGDYIKVGCNGKGYVTSVTILFLHDGAATLAATGAAARISLSTPSSGDGSQRERFVVTTVVGKEENYLMLSTKGSGECLNAGSTALMVYEEEADGDSVLRRGLTGANLKEGDVIVAYISYRNTIQLISYTNLIGR